MNKEPRIYGKWDRERLIFIRAHHMRHVPRTSSRVKAATVVDHIIHKLKEALRLATAAIAKAQNFFWSRKNWQRDWQSSTTTQRSSEWRSVAP